MDPRRRTLVTGLIAVLAIGGLLVLVSTAAASGPSKAFSFTGGTSGPSSSTGASAGSGSVGGMGPMPDGSLSGGSVSGGSMGGGMGSISGSPGSTAGDAGSVSTAGFPSGPGEPGIFTDRCRYDHEDADDPILAPGRPGASMHHNFYGNTSTSASSTAATLVGGPTTCSTSADASAYWTPVLYQNGTALPPSAALIYWRRPIGNTEAVQPVPAGLQMIAGNETATAPQPRSVIAWTCSGKLDRTRPTNTPHDCPAGSNLRLVVTFPSCWDGHTLGGADQANVVYRDPAGCPASHPVQIPQIVFHVNYPTSSAGGLTLSMTPTMQGSTNTEHVDFINGWNQGVLSQDVAACVATSTRCGPVIGPTATPRGPSDDRSVRPLKRRQLATRP